MESHLAHLPILERAQALTHNSLAVKTTPLIASILGLEQ
jgi:hypothetical protein